MSAISRSWLVSFRLAYELVHNEGFKELSGVATFFNRGIMSLEPQPLLP